GDVIDMHDVETSVDKARHMAARGLHYQAASRCRLEIAGTDRGRRIDYDGAQPPLSHQTADKLLRCEFRLLVRSDHVGDGARGSLVRWPAANQTEGSHTARIDYPFDPSLERCSQQIARAFDIGAKHRARIGAPESVSGGDMKPISLPGDGTYERFGVLQRALHALHRKIAQVTPVAIRSCENTNPMAGLQQDARHRRPDKAGCASNEA